MKHALFRLSAAAIVVATLAACGTQTSSSTVASQPRAAVYVPIKAEQVTREAIAKGVYELVYSPRQNAVFVATSGGWGEQADPARILRLNPETLAVEAEIPLRRKAFGLALDDTAQRLYVGNTVDTSLTVVDLATQREVAVIQLEEKVKGADGKERYARDLRQLVVDPDKHRVYVAAHAFDAGSVLYVVNTDTLQIEKRIDGLGNAKAPGIWLDAANDRLFISNLLGEILTIDTCRLEIAKRFKTEIEQPLNMALDAASNRLFVTDQGLEFLRNYMAKSVPGYQSNGTGNRVVVLNADTGAVQASFPTGEGPLQLWLDSERKRLYVTNRGAGTVGVHDSDTYALLDTIAVPTHPNTLAQDAKHNVLYVSIKNGEGDPKEGRESVARLQFPE